MTPDRAKFNKEVEKGLLDRGVNTPIRAMTEQETMEQRIKIQADQIASLKRQIGRLETQLANELLVDDGSPLTPHGEAIAAGDGTLHGAIDYWQQQAFTMAAGQCIVTNGGLMADDHGHQYCDMERQRDEWKRKAEEAARDAANGQKIMRLLASIFYYGDFTAETANERELQAVMESAGWWPFKSEADLLAAIEKARDA